MPNWVRHHLTVTGPKAEQERFVAECFSKTDDGVDNLDFDKLIPQPDDIRNYPPALSTTFIDDNGDLRFPAWYEWRCQNWGTKWNACNTRLEYSDDGRITLSFDTAWSCPSPIYYEIAKRFPLLKFEGNLIEEMMGFGGNIVLQNGSVKFEDRSAEIQEEYARACEALRDD